LTEAGKLALSLTSEPPFIHTTTLSNPSFPKPVSMEDNHEVYGDVVTHLEMYQDPCSFVSLGTVLPIEQVRLSLASQSPCEATSPSNYSRLALCDEVTRETHSLQCLSMSRLLCCLLMMVEDKARSSVCLSSLS
jgi:hypothetical protein